MILRKDTKHQERANYMDESVDMADNSGGLSGLLRRRGKSAGYALIAASIAAALASTHEGWAWLAAPALYGILLVGACGWAMTAVGVAVLLLGYPIKDSLGRSGIRLWLRRWVVPVLIGSAVIIAAMFAFVTIVGSLSGYNPWSQARMGTNLAEAFAHWPLETVALLLCAFLLMVSMCTVFSIPCVVYFRLRRLDADGRAQAVSNTARKIRFVSEEQIAWFASFVNRRGDGLLGSCSIATMPPAFLIMYGVAELFS